jgi:hypothetical protein
MDKKILSPKIFTFFYLFYFSSNLTTKLLMSNLGFFSFLLFQISYSQSNRYHNRLMTSKVFSDYLDCKNNKNAILI